MTQVEVYRNRQLLINYHTDQRDQQKIIEHVEQTYKGIWTDIRVIFLIKNK